MKRFEMCAISKSQELKQHFWHILSQSALFTAVDLASWWTVHTGTQGAVSPKPALDTAERLRAPRGWGPHTPPWFLCSLCLMHSWSLGPGVIYFRVVPRVATEQDRLVGRLLCLIWNWCFCVILWKVPFSRGESSTDITHNALIYIQQIAHWHGK